MQRRGQRYGQTNGNRADGAGDGGAAVASGMLQQERGGERSPYQGRARAELARVLASYMNGVSNDYVASSAAGDRTAAEQTLSREIENVTRLNLSGARIIGRWRDPKSNTIYSLAELDLKQVKDTTRGVDEMNKGFNDYVNSHGETIFDRMAEERKK